MIRFKEGKGQFFYRFSWWFLWGTSVFLLRFFIRDLSGVRIQIPDGYYIYYIISAVIVVILCVHMKVKALWSVDKHFLAAITFLTVTLTMSALLGARGGHNLKVLGALFIATLPFVILGRKSIVLLDEKVMDPVLATAIFCALGAWWLSFNGPVSVNGVTLENYLHGGHRWSFLFEEANGLALMLAAGITVLFFRISVTQSPTVKFFYALILLPFLLIVFWKTNSRGSLLWIMIAICCYGGLIIRNININNTSTYNYLFPGFVLVLGLCVLLSIVFFPEIKSYMRLYQSDLTTGRMKVWLVIIEEFKKYPILGFGYGATGFVTENLTVKSPLNVFVGVLGETGLLGIFALLWLWSVALWRAGHVVINRINNQDKLFQYAFFMMVMLFGIAAQQLGEWDILFATPLHFLFFFLIAAAWKLGENDVVGKKQAPCSIKVSPTTQN